MRFACVIAPWTAVLQLCGCSGGESRQTGPATPAPTSGVIAVTIRGGGHVEVVADARLLSMRDVTPRTAHLLAGAPPRPDGELTSGSCRVTRLEQAYDEALSVIGPDAEVKKLDAGVLTVVLGNDRTRLAPVLRPEVTTLVEGVSYQAEAEMRRWASAPTGDVLVDATGGEDILGFAVRAPIPEEPSLLVDPIAPEVLAARSADLEVWWVPSTLGAADVEVVVAWAHDGGGELRCRAADSGFFSVPRRVVESIEGPGSYSVAVERVARAPFRATGLEAGILEVRVVSSRPLRWR